MCGGAEARGQSESSRRIVGRKIKKTAPAQAHQAREVFVFQRVFYGLGNVQCHIAHASFASHSLGGLGTDGSGRGG